MYRVWHWSVCDAYQSTRVPDTGMGIPKYIHPVTVGLLGNSPSHDPRARVSVHLFASPRSVHTLSDKYSRITLMSAANCSLHRTFTVLCGFHPRKLSNITGNFCRGIRTVHSTWLRVKSLRPSIMITLSTGPMAWLSQGRVST